MGGPPSGQGNWINTHLVYTHGFGVVAARASTAQANTGSPAFTESDIPPTGSLGLTQPRIYFGQQETSYAIVGGRRGQAGAGLPQRRHRRPAEHTYTGGGGVPVGSPLNRLLYAIKFRRAEHPAVGRHQRQFQDHVRSATRWPGWPRSRRS